MAFTPPPRPQFRRPVYKRCAAFRACDDAQERGFELVFGAIFAPESKSGCSYGRQAHCSSSWLFTLRTDRDLSRRVHAGPSIWELSNERAEFQIK